MKVSVKVFSNETDDNLPFNVILFESYDRQYSGMLYIDKGSEIPTELEIIMNE